MTRERYVLKNTKTNQYSDGNYQWTPDINEARVYYKYAETCAEAAARIEALEAALRLRAEAEEECLKAVDHVGHYNSGGRINEAKGWVRNAFTEFEEAERAALEDKA